MRRGLKVLSGNNGRVFISVRISPPSRIWIINENLLLNAHFILIVQKEV